MEQITLYFKHGNSDKIYQTSIHPVGNGYHVQFAYGRRGTTLQTGTKTKAPVPYAHAKKILDKLVLEKTAKGYTPGADGTPYQRTDHSDAVTGILPMLLNSIEEEEADALLSDPEWIMQRKYDGRRLLIKKEGNVVTGINRRGLVVPLPEPIAHDVGQCSIDFIMDGEAIGDEWIVFDILSLAREDITGTPYSGRYLELINALAGFNHRSIGIAATAIEVIDKYELWDKTKRKGREGVVFKHRDSTYTPGRPNSGGMALKFKFHESASFVVSGVNAQRSVSLSLLRGHNLVPVGNVTIPPNRSVPEPWAVVDVRYLYAFRESNSVYQPVYLGTREDIDTGDCLLSQLKYKPLQ